VDQLGEDCANPNYEAMLERFGARFGRVSRSVVVTPSYDTARAALHGIANARIAAPGEVKAGLERIKWMPCANGGPGCYLTFAEYDHRGYEGDFSQCASCAAASCTSAATPRGQLAPAG
jgi:branched-chain amino acid transport system substrate-binding protein